jgi:SAM-dependent methyltransferase
LRSSSPTTSAFAFRHAILDRVDDLEFRRDLYRGTASYYDRFRVPYPQSLVDDLAQRVQARGGEHSGEGRLLDLACGTGQISFALHRRFGEVLALDQEPDMVAFAACKAEAAGIGNIRFQVGAAEDLDAPDQSFDLVAIGNAYHRLPRQAVAARVMRWLRPGRFLALVWGGGPTEGQAPWQQAMSATMQRWRTRARDGDRVPSAYEQDRRDRPDRDILRDAGFQVLGKWEFPAVHEWSLEALIGFLYSTSVLSRAALGDYAPALEDDLRRELGASEPGAVFRQETRFAYELARRPAG